jgi:CO dehydrogenase nickel-insertion accessory protein CooC1
LEEKVSRVSDQAHGGGWKWTESKVTFHCRTCTARKERNTMAEKKALAGRKIGIFGKGGSGKSTTVVLLAKALVDYGYQVCILDADSTNVGLAQALELDRSPVSLIHYFGGTVFSGGLVTCPVDDPTPLPGAEILLDEFPSKYHVQDQAGIILLTAGKIGDQGPGAGCDGPISKIARDLKCTGAECSVTLVDFKAGFEDSARGVITGLDWAVVTVDPTSASIQLAANMKDMVAQMKAGRLPATAHLENPELIEMANRIFREARIKGVVFVLSKIADQETESYLREKLREKGIEPIGVIHRDPSISLSWLKGAPIDATKTKEDAERIVEELEAAEET